MKKVEEEKKDILLQKIFTESKQQPCIRTIPIIMTHKTRKFEKLKEEEEPMNEHSQQKDEDA